MSFFFGTDLWDEMSRMQRQLEDLTDVMDHKRPRLEAPPKKGSNSSKALCPFSSKAMDGFFNPTTDLAETENSYVVSMDLPGVKKDELDVSVHNGVLTVSGVRRHKFVTPEKEEGEAEKKDGEKKEGDKKEKKLKHKVIKMESYYGSFERSVSVPAGTKDSDVEAKFDNGVLTITIAKPHKDEPKKIEVQ